MKPFSSKSLSSAPGLFRNLANAPLCLLPALIALAGAPFPAKADTATVNGITWTYTVSDGVASLGGGTSDTPAISKTTTGSIQIPSKLGGYTVKRIGDYAFEDCTKLTSITIPDCVTAFGRYAFHNCSGLNSISIPSNVTKIGYEAFAGCKLQSVHIHDLAAWCEISFGSFYCANPLYQAGHLFVDGKEVTDLVIPDGVKSIQYVTFVGGRNFTSVTIPSSITTIGYGAFSACYGLKAVYIQDLEAWCRVSFGARGDSNPLYHANRLFVNGNEIMDLLIPPGITSIGNYAFYGFGGLKSVTIPDSVTSIGSQAFSDCSGLTTILVSHNNSVYDSRNNCNAIVRTSNDTIIAGCKSTIIPDSVTNIGNYAFYYCSGLPSITMPDSVTSIGDYAFYYCSGLTSITIPDSVTSIGGFAFSGCSSLKTLFVPLTLKGTDMLANAKIPSNCSIIYPREVKFDSSGGTCATSSAIFYPQKPFGKLPSATRTGYDFDGWTTERNGQGALVTETSILDNDISTLYAKWTPQPYTVKFSANGGTGTMAAQSMVYGTAAKLRKNAFTREGFVFLGWSKTKTGAVAYANQASVKNLSASGGTVILYAQWANKAYKVAFDANGGTLPKGKSMPAQKMTYGKAAALQANAFTRKGYVFYGWSRSKTGKREFANKATVQNLRTDGKTQTLYAVWAKETYSVAFDSNGGKGKMSAQKMAFGKAANLAKNAFTRKGWLFLGWAKTPDGAVAYKDAASVKNLRTDGKTTTLYAVWEKAQMVNFNANGGTCDVAYRDYKVGTAYGTLPVPTRKWYVFSGWHTAASGGTLVTQFDKAENTTTRTLYAQWGSMPILLDAAEKSLGPAAATKVSVGLDAKAAWTADTDAGWISLRTQGGKAGKGSLVFDVEENHGAARAGDIIVSANGQSALLAVKQSAKTLAVSPTAKTHSYKAASSQKIAVKATIPWTAKSSASWLKLKTTSGKGTGTLLYDITENKAAGRTAKITVSGGGMTAVVEVTQKGKNGSVPSPAVPGDDHYLQIFPTSVSYAAEGSTNETAVVLSDVSWKAATSQPWILLETPSGSGSGEIIYRIEPNAASTERSGAINVTGGGMKATLTIAQNPAGKSPYLVLTPNEAAVASSATKGTIWVDANVVWEATPDCTWLTLGKKSGNGSAGIQYTVAANGSDSPRTATVLVAGGGVAAEFTLTQDGSAGQDVPIPPETKFLRVNPANATHGGAAGKGGFMVESNVPWTVHVSAKDSWIVPNIQSGSNYRQIEYRFGSNPGAQRKGTVTIIGGGLSATFTVIQEGAGTPPTPHPQPPPSPKTKTLTINQELDKIYEGPDVPAEGLTVLDCHVEASPEDLRWRVSTSGTSWIHPETYSATGSRFLKFKVDSNLDTQNPYREKPTRIGSVTVKSGYLWAVYWFKQLGFKAYLSVTPTDYYYKSPGPFSWRGGSATSSVFANIPWTAKVTKGGSWIHITQIYNPDNGSGQVSFKVDENEKYTEREGTILVYDTAGNNKSAIIWIKQGPAPILEVSPYPTKTITHEAGQSSLGIRSNVPWSATVVSQDNFITGFTNRGDPNQPLKFKFKANTDFESRTGYITISGTGDLGKGKSVKIKIVQKGKPTLTVSPTSKTTNYKAQSDSFKVKANVSWKATAKVSKDAKGSTSWFALVTKSGKPSSSTVDLAFKVAKNTTGKSRSATITVKGGGLTRRVMVTQTKEPKISLSPASKTVKSDSVSSWFYVTANLKWTAKSSADWLEVKSIHVDASGTKNGGYVEYKATANKLAKKRKATITVTGGGKSVVFTLTQKGRPNLCFYDPDEPVPAVVFNNYGTRQTQFVAGESPSPVVLFAINNTGGSPSGGFTIKADLFVNGELKVPLQVPAKSFAAAQEVILPISVYGTWSSYDRAGYEMHVNSKVSGYAPLKTGTYTIRVMLDAGNSVTESDETDNVYSVSFTVISDDDTSSSTQYASSPEWSCEPDCEISADAPSCEDGVSLVGAESANTVVVVASGGEDAGAVADGDEETAWTPDAADGAWCVLTFPEPVDATNAELVGDGLPDGTRLLFSEDSENWHEELPARVQYVWAVFPATDEPFAVREIRLLSK